MKEIDLYSKEPDYIDVFVGQRLRQKRTLKGMTQSELAHSIGLTFQQIQKYEQGSNRIGSSRLYDFSRILDVSIGYFFDGVNGNLEAQNDPTSKRETLELVRAFSRIKEDDIRAAVLEIVSSVSK